MKAFTINDKVYMYDTDDQGEVTGKPVIIPSQMYPLTGKLQCFTMLNTEPCIDEQIQEIFDATEAAIGFCYQNTEHLATNLIEAGINKKRIKTYCGWLFIGEAHPIHHCFLILDDKHLLDFSVDKEPLEIGMEPGLDLEAARKYVVDKFIERRQLRHSERATFGQANRNCLYVASRCKPSEGRKLYNRLVRSFPNHPCVENIDSSGASPTQREIMKRTLEEIGGQGVTFIELTQEGE